jgi:hypothetical protein
VARDVAGNATVSAPVSVAVANGGLRLSPQDTFVSLDATNYSSQPTLTTYTWPDNKVANAIVLKFDLSPLPTAAVVQQATLHLTLTESDRTPDTSYTVTAHKLQGKNPSITSATGHMADGVTPWTPNSCCYDGVPLAQADISPAYDTRTISKTPGDNVWTITSMVQEWQLDPSTNFGLLLNGDASSLRDRYRSFASMEHTDTSLRPFLLINYSVPALDVLPPVVAITAPVMLATVSGPTTVSATATDDAGVVGVQFKLDGAALEAEDTTAPYSISWNTTAATNGTHMLTAVARDAAGHATTSPGVSVTVANDTTPPTVTLTAPANGTTVSGTISTSATATDDSGVVGVQFKLDGATLAAEDTTAPYSISWNTTTAANGTHTLTAVARDAAGHTTTSPSVTVTVMNDTTPPTVTLTAPANGTAVSGTIPVSAAATDDGGVAGVQFRLDGATLGAEDATAPYAVGWNTTMAANGTHTLTAVARDAAGNTRISPAVSVTVMNDITPPAVTVTVPPQGATVSATTTVAATASDNVAVAGVQFKLDGANLGAEDASPPYSITWDTTTTGDGSHAITAVARDGAGNQTTSLAVSVMVSNGSGGIVFESNWNAGIGSSTSALTDSGKWPIINQYDSPPTPGMSVVAGGPNGQNALRVQQRGPLYPVEIAKRDLVSQSHDYFLRYYFKTDDTSSAGDHIVTVGPGIGIPPGDSLTFLRKYGGATDWRMVLSAYGCGDPYGYPLRHWGPGPRLANGQWYRLEYHVDFVDSNHMRVHPRIYNAADTLLYDDDDFRQEDWGSSSWNGRNNWTLASFYAAGHTFCVDPAVMNDLGLDNNGQAGATNTGLYWYFAGVQVRSDTWPGPLSGGGGDTTPPSVSVSAPSSGATVSGSVAISATASDNVGVAGVQFKLDGTNLDVEDTTPPYAILWNTATATEGSHTITGVARDMAGNQTSSVDVTVTVANAAGNTISALYPGDAGIENHPDVVFVEMFEEPTLTDLFNRWTDIRNGGDMSFSTDVPAGSPPGSQSVNIPIIGGTTDGGHLYKLFTPGFDDALYIRYYIKYPTTGSYRHDGIWLGGSNPALPYPNPQAGTRPAGNDRFIAAAEQTDNGSRFDHYNYWMNMRVSGDGHYWGNLLLNSPSVTVSEGQWVCVEQMVKLNNPVDSCNGEHAIWVNGVKVSHLGQGFPNGSWSGGIFTQNPSGSPFEGFRWRSDAGLKLNYIWLQNYSVDNLSGVVSLKFDHVVVAKSPIGCLAR